MESSGKFVTLNTTSPSLAVGFKCFLGGLTRIQQNGINACKRMFDVVRLTNELGQCNPAERCANIIAPHAELRH